MKYLIIASSLLFLAACSPKIAKPTAADETRGKVLYADVTLANLEKGHSLYNEKCGGCHKLINPTAETDEKWKKILPVMGKKAKLDPAQYELIERYVYTMRANKKK